MADHGALHTSALERMNGQDDPRGGQEFLMDHLNVFIDDAWLLIEAEHFPELQHSASHLKSCARVLKHGFLVEVAAMLAVAADEQDDKRCQLFLSVVQWEWRRLAA